MTDIKPVESIVLTAAQTAVNYFKSASFKAWRKDDGSIVTQADVETQRVIVDALRKEYDGCVIVGEEEEHSRRAGVDLTKIPLAFALDPIDGTASYARGVPTWCVCAAAIEYGKATGGAVYAPMLDEMYFAQCDSSVPTLNGKPLAPAAEFKAVTSKTYAACDGKFLQIYESSFPGKIRSLGSGAIHLCLLAKGAVEFSQLNRFHIWDVAACDPILRRLGYEIFYESGRPFDLESMLETWDSDEPIFAGQPGGFSEIKKFFKPRKK